MSGLKPVGSEKLQGDDKIKRILEIARYKENIPNSINESNRNEYKTKLVDGNVYFITKEKMGYVIKKGLNESTSDYIDSMKNRVHYNSYSEALKKLNLIAAELNRLNNVNEGISLFNEDKKYFLKTPKTSMEQAEPSVGDVPPPSPEMGAEPTTDETPAPPAPSPEGEGPIEPEMPEEPADAPDMESDMNDEGESDMDVSFKTIQKLTGKLAQKIRDFKDKDEEISSKDAKYVVNSILSAIMDNLEDDDKEDIITKLEGEEESDYGMEPSNDEEPEMDVDSVESEVETEEEPAVEPEGEMGETYRHEMEEEDVNEKFVSSVMDKIFSESKVDKVLSKYFVINENEKKFKKQKEVQKKKILEHKSKSDTKNILNLSVTEEQKMVAENIIVTFPEIKFIGKTNKNNLVFEHNNKQLKVSPKGDLL